MLSLTSVFVLVLPLLAAATPFKRAPSKYIHPNGDTSLCLAVTNLSNGARLQVRACSRSGYKAWDIVKGDQRSVRLSGTNYCLDAGVNPHNKGAAKIWQCYPGLAQQRWYYTNDQHIAITNGDQCLDTAQTSGGRPQTYACRGGNSNQIFSTTDAGSGTGSSTVTSTVVSTVTVTVTAGVSTTPSTIPSTTIIPSSSAPPSSVGSTTVVPSSSVPPSSVGSTTSRSTTVVPSSSVVSSTTSPASSVTSASSVIPSTTVLPSISSSILTTVATSSTLSSVTTLASSSISSISTIAATSSISAI